MGSIKHTYIKRIGEKLLKEVPEEFKHDFQANKLGVNEHCTKMGKKIRNRIAGYITKVKKQAANAVI